MASVFLSYDREDSAKASTIAAALENAGHSVWWDRHIKGGAQYGREIEHALKAADAVVVLWSERSVESAWVRDEAAAGRDGGRLVPVKLDNASPPMGFRQYQTIDMSGWKGRGRAPRLNELLDAVNALGTSPVAPSIDRPPAAGSWGQHLPRLAIGVALAAVVALGLLFWRPWDRGASASVVAVMPADQSGTTIALARDLLVQLGRLHATSAGTLQLVGSGSAEKANLIFEVSESAGNGSSTASVALLQGKGRVLLWSKNFQQPNGRQADLRQQLAFSAAQVLRCAAEASDAEGKHLNAETKKLYLNGCAESGESLGTDARAVVPIFERVTRNAPRFRAAWAKLLLAESNIVSSLEPVVSPEAERALRHHLAQARTTFPDMAEIQLAEIALLPANAFAARRRLVDRAKQLAPDNPVVLVYRSSELMRVGRLNEAVIDAERAAQLDPLSPALRNAHISVLAYSGRLAQAQEALNEAERLWPGASSVLDAKFRYHLRFGDPRVALHIVRTQGTSRLHETFLVARIDPSAQNVDRAVQLARAALARYNELAGFSQLLAQFNREDEIYKALADWKGPLPTRGAEVFFRPTLKRFREDPRFLRVAKRFGLLDYWRKSGHWPDFCFEPDLPYDCKAEAATIAA